jgi:lysophospholipase L1-like esterase
VCPYGYLMKDLHKNIILAIASTLIAGGLAFWAAEALLSERYSKWKAGFESGAEFSWGLTIPSPNPALLWEYRPNSKGRYRGSPLIATNRYGFRDRDYDGMSRPKVEYRIAFIGDSITLGLFVNSEDTFERKLEEFSRLNYPQTRAMNFGIDGYDIHQIGELLRSRVLQFEPNKVIYMLCLNDFDFGTQASGAKVRYFRQPTSFVWERLTELFTPTFRYSKDKDTLISNVMYHKWYYERNKADVFQTILDMKHWLERHNTEFEVVIVPIFLFVGGSDFAKYPLKEMHAEIANFLFQNNIDYLDLLDRFQKQDKDGRYFALDVWHPNVRGHAFIAQHLFQDLSQKAAGG